MVWVRPVLLKSGDSGWFNIFELLPMNAAQLRRIEEKLNEAEEFFLNGSMLDPALQAVRDDLRDMLRKVVEERIRAEMKDSRHPFSKRAAL